MLWFSPKKTPTNALLGAGAWPWAHGERHRTMMQSAEEQIKKLTEQNDKYSEHTLKILENPVPKL